MSRRLPRFQRQAPEVRALLPERYLPGLAQRDFERAFRGLVGDAVPLSPRALLWLTATWQGPCAVWQQRALSALTPVYARVSLGRRRVRESRA